MRQACLVLWQSGVSRIFIVREIILIISLHFGRALSLCALGTGLWGLGGLRRAGGVRLWSTGHGVAVARRRTAHGAFELCVHLIISS